MPNIKSGKEEIVYLLTKAIDKYRRETGQEIVQNTNRKNYESLAILLSEISNNLPETAQQFGADSYSPDIGPKGREYPHRKYDITGGQIKDALMGIVSNPRPFLVDSCYIYLYGVGRKYFKQNPVDKNLVESSADYAINKDVLSENKDNPTIQQLSSLQTPHRKKLIGLVSLLAIALIALLVLFISYRKSKKEWQSLKNDMNILPYTPSRQEIDSLEGIWLCYTGSPQARVSNPGRYHKVVSNLIEIRYKDGYFTYNRFGASFNHIGYVQFESPGIVSVYTRINKPTGKTESPRHSLLNLYSGSSFLSAISASWSFDVGDKNKIIGIREVYIKQGKGGKLEEVINDVENASCQCKIIRWHRNDNTVKTYYLKNQLLDSIPFDAVKPLINEASILLSIPQEGVVLTSDSIQQ
jgi:hypothetical protein